MWTTTFLTLLFALAPPQDTPTRTKPLSPELMRHQGTWCVVSFIYQGTKADPEVMASILRTVEGERVVWTREGKSFSATGLMLDPKADPPAIDVIPEGGPHRDKHVLGIYRLEGTKLTLCMADPDMPRPDTFDAGPDSHRTLIILEREREIDHPASKPENQIDLSRLTRPDFPAPATTDQIERPCFPRPSNTLYALSST